MISFYVTKSGEPFSAGKSKSDTLLTIGIKEDNDIVLKGVYAANRFLMVKIQTGILKASCVGSVRGLKINKVSLSSGQDKLFPGSGKAPITIDDYTIYLKIGEPDGSWPSPDEINKTTVESEAESSTSDQKPDNETKFSQQTDEDTGIFNTLDKTEPSEKEEQKKEKFEKVEKFGISNRVQKEKKTEYKDSIDDDFELFTPVEEKDSGEANESDDHSDDMDDLLDSFDKSTTVEKSRSKSDQIITVDEIAESSTEESDDDFTGLFDSEDDDVISLGSTNTKQRKKSIDFDDSGLQEALEDEPQEPVEVEAVTPEEVVDLDESGEVLETTVLQPSQAPQAQPEPVQSSPKKMKASRTVSKTQEAKAPAPKPVITQDKKEIERKTTVRYFEQMTINKNFPLLIVFSKEQLDQIVQRDVAQIEGKEKIKVGKEKPVVTVIPQFPGCICVPERQDVDLTPENAEVTFWVTPVAEGKLPAASVKIQYEGNIIQKIDCPTRVVKSTAAKVTASAAIISPIFFSAIESVGLDPKSQIQGGFPIVKQISNWLEGQSTALVGEPILSGMTLLGLLIGFISMIIAIVFYFRSRPKESDPVREFLNFNTNSSITE